MHWNISAHGYFVKIDAQVPKWLSENVHIALHVAKICQCQNFYVPKYLCAKILQCCNDPMPKCLHTEISRFQKAATEKEYPCAGTSTEPKSPLVKMFLWWNICIEISLNEMSDAKISPSKLHTVFFFLDIRNYWWYDECLRGYPQFSNGECPDVWSSRRSGCIHSIDYESLFANDHCKWDTSRYTNLLNNTNLSKTSF